MSSCGRCLAVWGAATAAAALLVTWLLPGSVTGVTAGPGGHVPWLVTGAAVVAAGCVTWLWVLVTLVVADALSGRPARAGVPAAVRRVVLTACGLSLAGALTVPAHADPDPPPPEPGGATQALLVGLPLPDRTTTTAEWIGALDVPQTSVPEDTPPEDVRVEPGDTLWSIARGSLPSSATDHEIDRRWRAIYRANLDAVGADPDLIRPGQRLLLPPSTSHPR